MERAKPVDMRKALQAADALKQAGVLFVPMPVLNEEDHEMLISKSQRRLKAMIELAEKDS